MFGDQIILQLAIAVSVRFMFSVTDLYNTIQSD